MDPFVQGLVGGMLILCVIYWMVKEGEVLEDEHQPMPKRNLELEHKLGGHREFPAWGCRQCFERK